MASIEHSLNHPLRDGESIKFKANCSSSEATDLKIIYPTDDDGTLETETFVFKDAHGNDLSRMADVFLAGAYVEVITDTSEKAAFIQNGDTNGYLETKMAAIEPQSKSVVLTANGWSGNTQTVSLNGVTAESLLIVSPAPDAENFAAYTGSAVRCKAQSAGKITFECTDVPGLALSVNVAVFG